MNLVIKNNLQGIVIPSMRTPKNIIELSKNELQQNSLVVETIDKKAYLSALSLSKIYLCNVRLNFNDIRSCFNG
jgi:hypothetical protein